MSLTNIEIPDSLFQRVQQIALEQQVTVDQFIAAAIAEKAATSVSGEPSQRRSVGLTATTERYKMSGLIALLCSI